MQADLIKVRSLCNDVGVSSIQKVAASLLFGHKKTPDLERTGVCGVKIFRVTQPAEDCEGWFVCVLRDEDGNADGVRGRVFPPDHPRLYKYFH